jgi:hypothetical protein
MSGDDDIVGGEIETPIAFVVSRVSEKDITSGSGGGQFVSSLCGEVGIAHAAEHTQVLIGGCDTVKGDIQAGDADCLARETVQQVRSSWESVDPVASRHRSQKEQGADHVIDGAKSALSFTVLQRGVGIRHPQDDPTGGEKRVGGGVVELTTVVTLDGFNGAAKLSGDKGEKINKVEKVSDLTRKGKVHTKWEQSSRMSR